MEISIIIAALLANLVTRFAKPSSIGLTADQQEGRKIIIRVMNAVFGLVALVVTYMLTGGTLDMAQVSTYIEIIVGAIVTFIGSQGMYFLAKKG